MRQKLPIVVMISGNGSNLQAIMDQCHAWVDILYVISDNKDAYGLQRAASAGIGTMIIEQGRFQSRDEYCAELIDFIKPLNPELIVLAGFMKILTPNFIETFDRIINIHPSLLPKHKGLHTHRRVLEAGDDRHGITIHFVNEELDAGPKIIQKAFDVQPDDTEESLEERVHVLEHEWYPWVVKEIATGTI